QQDGQPSPQEGTADPQPQKKDAPHEAKKDKVTLQSQQDPTAAAPAAVMPKQAAVAKPPEQQKPEATETRKPSKAIVQRVGPAGGGDPSKDPAGASDGSPAQSDAGKQSAQKPDQTPDPSAPAIPHLKLGEPVAAKPQSQANVAHASPDQSAAQAQLSDAQQQ